MDSKKRLPVPGPKSLPLLGNVLDIDIRAVLESALKLMDKYGPIYQLELNGKREILVGSQALVNELCDERRFVKCIPGGLEHLRPAVSDGLFTAYHGEEAWGIAHRILMPAFGPTKIRDMFDKMADLAEQLCFKWARLGSLASLDVVSDYTRLTLDTLGLCTMDYRFNSFYQGNSMHPFVQSMTGFLVEAGLRSALPEFTNYIRASARKRFDRDIKVMRDTSREIIERRRQNKDQPDDLLNSLLNGRDPQTGQGMSDDLIISNLITFLIAGHETTSGLLSFATYYLLKNPAAYDKAVSEVDRIIGSQPISVKHLPQLSYLDAVLKETLRLMPTAPGFAVMAQKREILGGIYIIEPGVPINILLHALQRDKTVFGEDSHVWKPERMLDNEFKKLPPNSWKPFGSGMRACIGRPFAWQESLLVLAMVLKTFKLEMDDPKYELKIAETLTIKPAEFRCRASLRHEKDVTKLVIRQPSGMNGEALGSKSIPNGKHLEEDNISGEGNPITILYGSNMGTCKALAYQLVSNAKRRGFGRQQVYQLNKAVEKIPVDEPVIIITASYDGNPTDDAVQFVSWLNKLSTHSLSHVKFAVFGCGHHDWNQTFHRIPKMIDELLAKAGATRLAALGTADAAVSDMFSDLDAWERKSLWPALSPKVEETTTAYEALVQIVPSLRTTMSPNFSEALVIESRLLTTGDLPSKKHLEIQLPAGINYRPGDHLRIIPRNRPETVDKVLAYFHLSPDRIVTMMPANNLGLPASTRISAIDLFSFHVELSQPATTNNISILIGACADQCTKQKLQSLIELDNGPMERVYPSVFDLLQYYSKIDISLRVFIGLLLPLRPRTYSVSSSPLWKPSHATVTLSIVDEPSWNGEGRYLGIASNYLAGLRDGSVLYLSIQPAKPLFHPPADVKTTPIIMICSGSGLGPFRGFIQDRIISQRQRNSTLAPALLFFGCRNPGDLLYEDEFKSWETLGSVNIKRAYSREPAHVDAMGCKYIQDRLDVEKRLIRELWQEEAVIYVCGSRKMADGVRSVLEKVLSPASARTASFPDSRYVVEVF